MSADANIKTIMGVYEAFGRGDVAAILDAVSDDVDWAAEADPAVAPWHGVRHGKDAVAKFFAEFGSTMEVEEFTPSPSPPTTPTCSPWCGSGRGRGPPARPRRWTCTTASRSGTARSPTTAAPRTPPRPNPCSTPNSPGSGPARPRL